MDNIIRTLTRRSGSNDPFDIARYLNIEVRFEDLGTSTRGMYYKKLRRRYIVIHRDLDDYWKRFICAHELGHDRLHPGLNRFWMDEHSFFNAGKFERQANQFALRLLTGSESKNEDETEYQYLIRCGIPSELHNCCD